jgi:hypothetical protein
MKNLKHVMQKPRTRFFHRDTRRINSTYSKKSKYNFLELLLSFLGLLFTGLFSPFWIGGTYMLLTGHGKGYSYDMGSEAGISIIMGVIMLILWLTAVIPMIIWSCRKWSRQKQFYLSIPIVVFLLCFQIGIFVMGIDDFLKQFGYFPK